MARRADSRAAVSWHIPPITPCNHRLTQPYDMHRRAQGGREPLRSDGKDYRADYEHDDLSPNNLKTPDALEANGPLCENYQRERNPNGSCQWHSEILQSCARLRLYLAGRRRKGRIRPCLRARALRRSGAQRG